MLYTCILLSFRVSKMLKAHPPCRRVPRHAMRIAGKRAEMLSDRISRGLLAREYLR